MSEKNRWLLVAIFAAAMAWVESATVIYLRTLVDRLEPYQANPLPLVSGLNEAELVREIATLVMLFAIGWFAGNTRQTRFAYSMLAFGVWDILYYVFLKINVAWPNSVWDWDILFLLPLPWWGPVIAPVSIATLMIIGGTLATQFNEPVRMVWPSRRAWKLSLAGATLALLVFMSDALRSLDGGFATIRTTLPAWFNWPVFSIALVLMAVPIIEMIQQIWKERKKPEGMILVPDKVNFGAQTFFLLLLYKLISRDT